MPALNHIHSYVRYKKTDKHWFFKCNDPECTHTLYCESNNRKLMIGKKSRCIDCGNEFIIDSRSIQRAVPKCLNCENTKRAKKSKRVKSLVIDLFGEQKPSLETLLAETLKEPEERAS